MARRNASRKSNADNKAKITAKVSAEGFRHLSSLAADIGIRRDGYLNRYLWDAVEALEELPANSPKGARVAQLVADTRSQGVTQVSVRLDSKLIGRINSVCEEKRVPRDLFFDAAFEDLALALNMAVDTVTQPYKHILDFEGTKLESCVFSDSEIDGVVGSIKGRGSKRRDD